MAFYLMVTDIILFSDANPEEYIFSNLIFPGMLSCFIPGYI